GKLMGLTAPPKEGSQRVREWMMQADKAALREANHRYRIILPVLEGQSLANCPTPARTVRDWVAKYRAAEENFGCGYVGLLPKVQERGNREPRFKEEVMGVLDQFIDKEYENHKQKTKREVYGEFVNVCQDKGLLTVPSYKTFVSLINRRPRYAQAKKRKGERAA